ncbi:MAG TPA: hypothetical protein VFP76_04250 [Gemmatimonadota bacterium]|nr:hypothetical protein [Gemmatimonadota bacterium]
MWIPFDTAAFALLVAALPARAEPVRAVDDDPRWQAFLGCWAPVTEAGAMGLEDHVLCFRQDESGAVSIATVVDDELRGEEVVRADGAPRAFEREGCVGTGSATWSADGTRVYLRSTLRCGEERSGRETTGVLALGTGGTLIDLRAVGAGEEHGVRTLRYRRLARDEYPASMRVLPGGTDDAVSAYAAAPLSVDDVVEAAGFLPAATVGAMLVELPTRFHADAETLLALADAGVDEEVLDIVVELGYPERFAMGQAGFADVGVFRGGGGMPGLYYDPWMGKGGYYYDRYSRYGYSPFGYPYGWGLGGGTIIIIDPDDDDPGTPGAAVKGHGYTRTDADEDSGGGKARPRRASRPTIERSPGNRSISRPSSSAGSRSSAVRKAQPKASSGDR